MSERGYTEHPDTYKARKKIRDIFQDDNFKVEEFKEFPEITDNMGEEIYPPYEADIFVWKAFIIELDSKILHGTRKKRIHDQWRDKNFKNQIDISTVRLLSKDINQQSTEAILAEIKSQLKSQGRHTYMDDAYSY